MILANTNSHADLSSSDRAVHAGSARFESFDAFWQHYLCEHSNPLNRTLHVAGTAAALGIVGLALAKRRPSLLLLAPLVGYGAAWAGHFVIEGNRPATFGNPLWSVRADLKLLADTVRQGLTGERKCCRDAR